MGEVHQGVGEIGAAGVHHTVGEVEELDGSVDEGETQGNKGVDAACDEAVEEKLLKHKAFSKNSKVPVKATLAKPFQFP